MAHILVIGGAGYIGTHMVKRLLADGCKVIVLDNLATGHADLIPGGTFIQGNLGDRVLLDGLFQENKIDAVMHFAALSLVAESVDRPLKYYGNNVAQNVTLLEAMVRNGVNKLIFSSTAAVYGQPHESPVGESHPCRPVSPYGKSKLMVETMLKDCDRAYDLKSISLRYFNAAGADDSASIGERHEPESHLIPLVLKTATGQRKDVRIFGSDYHTADGTAIRDYIHVNDLVDAHMLAFGALMNGMDTTQYNLGNGKGYSVKEVIDSARKITGKEIQTIVTDRRTGDPEVLVASSEKIMRELGWQPKYSDLEVILETAWQWHRKEHKPR